MWPIVNVPEEDRATAIGYMHKEFGKGRAWGRGVPEISCRTDRQTHRQKHSSQYFATALAGEVITVRRCSILLPKLFVCLFS